jgi:hypothetical protein
MGSLTVSEITDAASILILLGTLVVAFFAYKVSRASLQVSKEAAEVQNLQSEYQTKQFRLSSIAQIHQLLSTEDARSARRRVYNNAQALKKGVPPKEIEDDVAKVSGDIDIVGSMIEAEIITRDDFLKMYSGMVCNMWEILRPNIELERKKRNEPTFKHYFQNLAASAKGYRERTKLPPPSIREPWYRQSPGTLYP